MKEKRLWIFDFDGVLVFSVKVTFECIIESAKEIGVSLPGFNMLKESWGKSFEDDLFPSLAKKLNWTYVQKEYVLENFLNKNQKLIYPLPSFIFEFLKEASQSKDLAILTNRSLESLIVCADKLSLDLNLFKRIISPSNGLYKPDPKMFSLFWQDYKPEEALFIGDSINFDLKAARSHFPAIDFVAISSGLHEKSDFLEVGLSSELILESPVEMKKWL